MLFPVQQREVPSSLRSTAAADENASETTGCACEGTGPLRLGVTGAPRPSSPGQHPCARGHEAHGGSEHVPSSQWQARPSWGSFCTSYLFLSENSGPWGPRDTGGDESSRRGPNCCPCLPGQGPWSAAGLELEGALPMVAKPRGPPGRSNRREAGQQGPQEAVVGEGPQTLQGPGHCKRKTISLMIPRKRIKCLKIRLPKEVSFVTCKGCWKE